MSDNKIFQSEEEKDGLAAIKKAGNIDDSKKEWDGSVGGKRNEDEDRGFIKKDATSERRKRIFFDFKEFMSNEVWSHEKSRSGVRPEGNQQRNLDRETGGVEAEIDKGISEDDAWDRRSEEVAKMNKDAQDLNNASKSTRARAFIYVDKMKKKRQQEGHDHSAGATEGYVAKLKQWRQNKENDAEKGGGRVM